MDHNELLRLQDDLERTCDLSLQSFIDGSSKCVMLQGRLEADGDGKQLPHMTRTLRHYLSTPIVPAHRRALTSIMLSSHAVAVERLRFHERYRAPVPHAWRLCRFCRVDVEDEVHVLLKCEARPDLVALRAAFRRDVSRITGDVPCAGDLWEQLIVLLHDQRLAVQVAKYVYVVLEVFGSVPMFLPAPYNYLPLVDA